MKVTKRCKWLLFQLSCLRDFIVSLKVVKTKRIIISHKMRDIKARLNCSSQFPTTLVMQHTLDVTELREPEIKTDILSRS